jgi:pimeloyl-ACP methyl ester carboxylesterase
MPDGEPIPRPPRGLLLLEGRALLELVACLPAYPFFRRAPAGDGHPVLVLPGLMTSDVSTRVLRRFLRDRGYAAHGWKLGRNLGPRPELVGGLVGGAESTPRRRVSLVGWSLGGIYARELARHFPSEVRLVITLGTPFRDVEATNVPRVLRALATRRPLPDEAGHRAVLAEPLAVPSTAIYSRTDGVVAWQSCCEIEGPISESIEVASSHSGMGHHPVVLLTIADRLAQPDGAWKRFRSPAGWRWPLVPRTSALLGGENGAKASDEERRPWRA